MSFIRGQRDYLYTFIGFFHRRSDVVNLDRVSVPLAMMRLESRPSLEC